MNPIITTSKGAVEGRNVDGIDRFLGIPYAAPPFGAHRFLAPAPVAPWEGVRQGDAFGPTAPQRVGVASGGLPTVIEPTVAGDDILNLNVWTPAGREVPLPVLVWIHGGGFFEGSSANPWYDGAAFARQGLVVVSINYRFGAEGFLELEGAPSNRGLLDWVAALTWVHDEIAAFGGDPSRVTVMGQSAGGMAVSALLAAPAARGLFLRAILASAVSDVSIWSTVAARKVADAVVAELGIPRTRDAAAAIDPAAFLEAHAVVLAAAQAQGEPIMPPWAPVVDGENLPGSVFDTIEAGADIPVLVGSTSNEFAWMAYRDNPDDTAKRDEGQRLFADGFFRVPIQRFAEARVAVGAAPTFRYEFAWQSQAAPYIRAGHSLDIPFFFHNLDAPYFADYAGPNPPVALADEMQGAFAAFVRDGDPGWAPYGEGRAVRLFDDPSWVGTDADLGLPA
ncbi:MAG: carboxylesterase family protein [Pseudolysinimonas sp.]|uniref:carboxylesterase/lipase family protein n=1 Tax=Pseudolysinimonas sp. TaxID=2680009 RepID=UPI00326327F0